MTILETSTTKLIAECEEKQVAHVSSFLLYLPFTTSLQRTVTRVPLALISCSPLVDMALLGIRRLWQPALLVLVVRLSATARERLGLALAPPSSPLGDPSDAAAATSAQQHISPPPPPSQQQEPRRVEWLSERDFDTSVDVFSATWYMSKELFLQTNLSNIENVEGACFGTFRERWHLLRMSLDWLDYSVEHMSKWWRILGSPHDATAWKATTTTFQRYIARHVHRSTPEEAWPDSNLLEPTVALVAFQKYKALDSGDQPLAPPDHELTISSLGATLASLVQVGMGRIVVVCREDDDGPVVRDAFRLLDLRVGGLGGDGDSEAVDPTFTTVVRGSTLVYAKVPEEMAVSRYIPVNLPRAAVAGLKKAWEEAESDPEWTRVWLGDDPDHWKYVYLTEPDTILQTRPSVLRHLRSALDEGLILTPHRLQPIPYQADALGAGTESNLVPMSFKTPQWVNSGDGGGSEDILAGYCCDEQRGDHKPGRTVQKHCGDFWWTCGVGEGDPGNHARLEPYELIRLQSGTGVTTLAGSEHGRRCFPSRDPCQYNATKWVTGKAGATAETAAAQER